MYRTVPSFPSVFDLLTNETTVSESYGPRPDSYLPPPPCRLSDHDRSISTIAYTNEEINTREICQAGSLLFPKNPTESTTLPRRITINVH